MSKKDKKDRDTNAPDNEGRVQEALEDPSRRAELLGEAARRRVEKQGLRAGRAFKQWSLGENKPRATPTRDDDRPLGTMRFAEILSEELDAHPDPYDDEAPIDVFERPPAEASPDNSSDTANAEQQPPSDEGMAAKDTDVVPPSSPDTAGEQKAPKKRPPAATPLPRPLSLDPTDPGYRFDPAESAFAKFHEGAIVVSGRGAEYIGPEGSYTVLIKPKKRPNKGKGKKPKKKK